MRVLKDVQELAGKEILDFKILEKQQGGIKAAIVLKAKNGEESALFIVLPERFILPIEKLSIELLSAAGVISKDKIQKLIFNVENEVPPGQIKRSEEKSVEKVSETVANKGWPKKSPDNWPFSQ